MSTNSIYNSIKVTDKNFCKSLVKALEETSAIKPKPVEFSRPVRKMTKEEIEKVFNK